MFHPSLIAKDIADAIKSDRVAALQVLEYISRQELIEALGLEPSNEQLFEMVEERLVSVKADAGMRRQIMQILEKELDV